MSAQDNQQATNDDSPAAQLRFRLGPRHTQRGIPIIDDHTGQLVATVGPSVEQADLVASLFVNAPQLLYAIGRARRQLRAIVLKDANPDDEATLVLLQLLRDLQEQVTAKK